MNNLFNFQSSCIAITSRLQYHCIVVSTELASQQPGSWRLSDFVTHPHLYHGTENTANQNTGKATYTQWYHIQPSQHALVTVFLWYGIK